MIHRIARRPVSRLCWASRNQVYHRTWSFFVWERQSRLPPLAQGRIILAGKHDEAIGERMAVLRGAPVDQYRAWLRDGHWVLYAVGQTMISNPGSGLPSPKAVLRLRLLILGSV